MNTKGIVRGSLIAALLVAALALGACRGHGFDPDGDGGGDDDALADTGLDATDDGGGDVDTDVDSDADPDIPGCNYPGGPYGFERFATVGPMRWPDAVTGPDTTGEADLDAFHCDEEVNSVFIQVVTTA
jgi:hypothetical protein